MAKMTLSKKLAVCQLLSMGIPVKKIAELLEIGQSTVYRWKSNITKLKLECEDDR